MVAHILVVYADAAHAEVPLIVSAEAGYDVSVAAVREAPPAVAMGPYDMLLLAVPEPLATAESYRAAGCTKPMVAIAAEDVSADALASLRALQVSVVKRPYSIQTLRKAIARELATDGPLAGRQASAQA